MKQIYPVYLVVTLALSMLSTGKAVADGWGVELQAYPTGIVPGVRYEWLMGETDILFIRGAYNFTERSDFGEHEDESGGGPGIGIGWRHWKDERANGWHYGARLDVWDMEIDWEDDAPSREGETDIIVIQPYLELGYSWPGQGGSRIDITAGAGAEINVDTDGEDVGEGFIALIGISFSY